MCKTLCPSNWSIMQHLNFSESFQGIFQVGTDVQDQVQPLLSTAESKTIQHDTLATKDIEKKYLEIKMV